MDDNISHPGAGPTTEITVRLPEDLVRRLGARGALGRRVLEALALDEHKLGHLSRNELGRLLQCIERAGMGHRAFI